MRFANAHRPPRANGPLARPCRSDIRHAILISSQCAAPNARHTPSHPLPSACQRLRALHLNSQSNPATCACHRPHAHLDNRLPTRVTRGQQRPPPLPMRPSLITPPYKSRLAAPPLPNPSQCAHSHIARASPLLAKSLPMPCRRAYLCIRALLTPHLVRRPCRLSPRCRPSPIVSSTARRLVSSP